AEFAAAAELTAELTAAADLAAAAAATESAAESAAKLTAGGHPGGLGGVRRDERRRLFPARGLADLHLDDRLDRRAVAAGGAVELIRVCDRLEQRAVDPEVFLEGPDLEGRGDSR